MIDKKVVLITGGAMGQGRTHAVEFAKKGYVTVLLDMLDPEDPRFAETVAMVEAEGGEALAIKANICSTPEMEAAFAAAWDKYGRLDVVVANAGIINFGYTWELEDEKVEKALAVNLEGTWRTDKYAAQYMMKQGYGRIVNLSSVAGSIPIPFQTYYSASKAAINSYTMATANEVRPFGVQVCCVQPGDIRTGFTTARQKNPMGDDVYGGRIARSVAGMEKDEQNGMTPEQAGAFVAHTAMRKSCKPIRTIGLQYKFFHVLSRILPCRLLNWLVGLLYAK